MARRPHADRSSTLFRAILLACPAASVCFSCERAVCGGAPGRGRPWERAVTEHGPKGRAQCRGSAPTGQATTTSPAGARAVAGGALNKEKKL
jgi:hypothetical protein